ncbi:MAG: hypothetical protein WBE26_19395 [Phycisphaerae bacterium]
MACILADATGLVDWANTVVAVLALAAAFVALVQSHRSRQIASGANDISRDANRLAKQSVELQEQQGQLRLIVKPRIVCLYGGSEDRRPRPAVEVINLSVFPVTITGINWKATGKDLYWDNPPINHPFGPLPARLPPREALTALGTPTTFESLTDAGSIRAAVAITACGEQVEGMTQQWQEEIARMSKETRKDTDRAT